MRAEIKKARKSKNPDPRLLSKLKHQKRALIRAATRRKKAELKRNDAKQHYFSQKAFNKNPNRVSQRLFKSQTKAEPDFDEKICEAHFRETYSDELRNLSYAAPPGMKRPSAPKRLYGAFVPSRVAYNEILKKRPNKSAPGPNGLPYLVYKKLPCCADLLYQIIRRSTKERQVPKCFGLAVISLIPKDPVSYTHLTLPTIYSV